MAVHKDAPPAQSPILVDEVTLVSFHPKQGRRNLQGEELTAPEMFLAFACDVDRVVGHMNALTRLFRKNGAVRLRLEFVEQMELPRLKEIDPRPRVTDPLGTVPRAAQNGHGKTHIDELAAKPTSNGKPTPIATGSGKRAAKKR